MADAALDRASRRDAVEAARRVDDGERIGVGIGIGIGIGIGPDADVGVSVTNDDVSVTNDDDVSVDVSTNTRRENVENVENVPVSLLTGAPDGCQSAVFEALELGAPNAAAWIEAPLAAATHGEGAFLSEDAFLEALRAATPSVRAALGTAGTHVRPHVVLIARTRATPRVVRGVFLSAARRFTCELLETHSSENEKETDGVAIRYVPGSTASCVSASGFFPEAERRPADCAAAADGADVVVLPTAATERGDRADAAAVREVFPPRRFVADEKTGTPNGGGGSAFVDPDAETPGERLEDAKRWLVGFLGKATADARLVVGRARLRRDPCSCAIILKILQSTYPRSRWPRSSPARAARTKRRAPYPDASTDCPSDDEDGGGFARRNRNRSAGDRDRSAEHRRRRGRGARSLPIRARAAAAVAGDARRPRPHRAPGAAARAVRGRRADGAEEAPFRVTHARVTATLDPRGSPRERTAT